MRGRQSNIRPGVSRKLGESVSLEAGVWEPLRRRMEGWMGEEEAEGKQQGITGRGFSL